GHAGPGCGRQGLPPNSESCPQCDADLTCFQALDSLADRTVAEPEEFVKSADRERSSGSRFALFFLLFLLILLLLFFLFFFLKTKDRFQELNQRVTELNMDIRTARRSGGQEEQESRALLPPTGMDAPLSKALPVLAEHQVAAKENNVAVYRVTVEQQLASVASKIEKPGGQEGKKLSENQADALVTEQSEDRLPEEELPGESVRIAESGTEEPVARGQTSSKVLPKLAEATELIKKTPDEESESLVTVLEPLPAEKWSGKAYLYQTKKTDTLWGIAERFYGDGKYYPVIMEQNPHLVISNINDEETIRLLVDRSVLKDIYKRRTEWRDGLLLWKHKVLVGETGRSIFARFAPPGYSDRVFYSKKPLIVPGNAVRVILR
ncbi:MAG: hypothetical protein D3924_18155, partial [Candidatus Electrothrix sp. AR4]|nr:hypothetical protein [Candidatus Electrothrix sp. AR4]